jgi:hypothetical protein
METVYYNEGETFEIGHGGGLIPSLRFRTNCDGEWRNGAGKIVDQDRVYPLSQRLPVESMRTVFKAVNFELSPKYRKYTPVETHGVLHTDTNNLMCKGDEQSCQRWIKRFSHPRMKHYYEIVELSR